MAAESEEILAEGVYYFEVLGEKGKLEKVKGVNPPKKELERFMLPRIERFAEASQHPYSISIDVFFELPIWTVYAGFPIEGKVLTTPEGEVNDFLIKGAPDKGNSEVWISAYKQASLMPRTLFYLDAVDTPISLGLKGKAGVARLNGPYLSLLKMTLGSEDEPDRFDMHLFDSASAIYKQVKSHVADTGMETYVGVFVRGTLVKNGNFGASKKEASRGFV